MYLIFFIDNLGQNIIITQNFIILVVIIYIIYGIMNKYLLIFLKYLKSNVYFIDNDNW